MYIFLKKLQNIVRGDNLNRNKNLNYKLAYSVGHLDVERKYCLIKLSTLLPKMWIGDRYQYGKVEDDEVGNLIKYVVRWNGNITVERDWGNLITLFCCLKKWSEKDNVRNLWNMVQYSYR